MSIEADFINELAKHFSGDVRLDAGTRALYSTDASIYQIEPLGVALPKTQEDLIAAVELAARYRVPILPRGAGSSLAGQAIGQALILDCSRHLDTIVQIDPHEQTATVEPGVILADLNRAAAGHGLTFGPDPASAERATLGGVIGNNATGAHSILYGMTVDHLVSADVILADGSLAVWEEMDLQAAQHNPSPFLSAVLGIRNKYADEVKRRWPAAWRNSAGYRLNYLLPWSVGRPPQWERGAYPPVNPGTLNLASLLAGSEGTLAVMRRAKLRLVPRPRHTILTVLAYESVAAACDAVPELLVHHPSAVELIPQMLIRLARSIPAYAGQLGFVRGDPAALLVVEFSGDEAISVRQKAATLAKAGAGLLAETAADQASVWNVRKVGLGLLDSRPSSARPVAFIEDCAIPVEHLGHFVREVERILAQYQVQAAFYAHASAGTLHIRPILDLKTGAGVRALRSIAQEVLALSMSQGGAMSSEHGDGLARAEWLERTYGPELMRAFQELKAAADPNGRLNPGKMNTAPPMDTHLRYGNGYQARGWHPALDFSRAGGLAGAIEQCNGQGVCRKASGVMCPSFQATREEQNSTRGRANLLRAMIATGRGGLTASQVFPALDLCLACKGCTAECPSGVDMPKLKFEFMHQYYKTHARPLRDYLFGYFHNVAGWLAPVAPLANRAMRNPLLKGLAAHIFSITPQRPFPSFVRHSVNPRHTTEARPAVLFLADALTHYVEPEVEQAAFELLDLAGYDVRVLNVIGAGASLYSKGLIEAARRHAGELLDELNRRDPTCSLPILGVEPPEIFMLKDDYAGLLPDRAGEIMRRRTNIWLPEEFLVRAGVLERWRGSLPAGAAPVKLQPHCHHRAAGPAEDGLPSGVAATQTLLQACGYNVEVLDTGCCGMAGTFGYDAEHFALSMQIGELRLFPQVRAAGEAMIAASGAACRMQIEQGVVGSDCAHPLVLAARVLEKSRESLALGAGVGENGNGAK